MKKEKPLPDKKVEELLRKYGPRIKRIPFTIDGIPTDEERNLTKDIWNSLDAETKKKILDKTRNVIASERKIKPEKIPEQTPYSMRLTHRFLQLEAKKH